MLNRHFKFEDFDVRFVIWDPKNFKNDCVYFATHSQNTRTFSSRWKFSCRGLKKIKYHS